MQDNWDLTKPCLFVQIAPLYTHPNRFTGCQEINANISGITGRLEIEIKVINSDNFSSFLPSKKSASHFSREITNQRKQFSQTKTEISN